ncbi:large conductance mechanosensitive channel protein MscL [Nocardia amamiensis]|uniref:Large-conductance mechanosensitive channel n=1 Tax=Nocardia amamiensis TaxID=404578 RepID=A0ABS0CN12_9NOCA|nr:large conductance mechanosensitive channel protein MscL [Nocardia amamiensis]MBF6297984.1 large conductance mechanosensitive channel protein MscL [Nocardia amamiensis]
MFKGFKEFLMRGNVIDLAVAVVMGTAFTAVVTSVTKGIINPLLAVFGSTNELGLGVQLIPSKPATFIAVGPIITAAIDFAMVAAVLYFVLILPMKTIKNRFGTTKAAEPTEIELLIEIRDLLAERHEAVRAERAADHHIEQEQEPNTVGAPKDFS